MRFIKTFEIFKSSKLFENKSSNEKMTLISYSEIKPEIKSNPNLPPLLLIPGGGGDPKNDFDILSLILSEDFNLFTFYYDETEKKDGKKECEKIANQIREKFSDKVVNILGFSLGAAFGFWIIKSLGNDFKGKFICVDASAPQADPPSKYVSNTLKNNTPRRYHCSIFWLDSNEIPQGQEPNENQQISFRYSYRDEIKKQINNKSKDLDLTKCEPKDFIFNLESDYISWRNKKSQEGMVIEFIDEAGKGGEGKHYKSDMNPSAVWVKGKEVEIPESTFENPKDYINSLMKENQIDDTTKVWIVEDKMNKGWAEDSKNKKKEGKYFIDPNCDWQNMIDFLSSQANGIVGSMMRNPEKPETLDDSVEVMIIRAGKLNDKNLTIEEIDEEEFPNNNTKVEILDGVEHYNVCQGGATEISKLAKSFFKE